MFPALTAARCDCCGCVEVDEVALALIEEAVMRFRDLLHEKVERDAEAWADAFAKADAARGQA